MRTPARPLQQDRIRERHPNDKGEAIDGGGAERLGGPQNRLGRDLGRCFTPEVAMATGLPAPRLERLSHAAHNLSSGELKVKILVCHGAIDPRIPAGQASPSIEVMNAAETD